MNEQQTATQYPPSPARPPRIAPLISLGSRGQIEVTRRTDTLRGEHVRLETIRGGSPGHCRLHLRMDAARQLGMALLALTADESQP